MTGDPWATLVAAAEAVRADAAVRDPWLRELPVVGIGWATVELERAARELGTIGTITPAARDETLGAAARRTRLGDRTRPAAVLLEPDTEGLLAAALARFGEGVRAVYLGSLDRADVDDTPNLGPSRPGPLGPARLVIGRPPWGPHVLLLAGVSRHRRDG
ncbi:MAG TPA: hypothetical protein VL749_06785 [Patescibacteria group bacterium]|nr:hypothetical protein [Patescibacteria group bacterium]